MGDKKGGLEVHNISIAAGQWGKPKIHNNSIASQKIICFMGDNNWGIAPWV